MSLGDPEMSIAPTVHGCGLFIDFNPFWHVAGKTVIMGLTCLLTAALICLLMINDNFLA